MGEKRLKEIALIRVATLLRQAVEECENFDDLKLSPGEDIKNLYDKIFKMQLELNKKIDKPQDTKADIVREDFPDLFTYG